VFDEEARWDWSQDSNEGTDASGDFAVEYLVVSSRLPPEQQTLEVGPQSPWPADHVEAESDQPTELGEVGAKQMEEILDIGECLDADHDDAPLRLRSLDSVIGQAAVPSHAARNLERGQLLEKRIRFSS
jgi:hypothetical protein